MYNRISSYVGSNPNRVLILLISLFFIQVFLSSFENSVTVDEFAHVPAGLYSWESGKFDIFITNPPLIKLLVSIPLVFTAVFPESGYQERWWLGIRFMEANFQNYHSLFIYSRLIVCFLSIIAAIILYCFTKEVFGVKPALFSVFIYIFSPNIIANSYLATMEMGTTLSILLFLYIFWKYLKKPTIKTLILCGIIFGITQITRFSSLLLVPIVPFLLALDYFFGFKKLTIKNMLASIAAIYMLGVLVINVGYLFNGSFKAISDYSFKSSPLKKIQEVVPSFTLIPLPEDYVKGIDFLQHEASEKPPVIEYLFGQYSLKGWWYYFLCAFLIKTPIPTLILFCLAILICCRNKDFKDNFIYLYLLSFFIIYFVYFSLSVANIGIRYLLPIYPIMFLLSAGVIRSLKNRGKYIVTAISAWLIIGTLHVYPNHLTYFNELVGGPSNGYHYLADSNVDWGQGFICLKKYMKKHNIKEVYLSTFGLVDPAVYGIKYKNLPPTPVKGTIALSVNHYLGISPWKQSNQRCAWVRNKKIIAAPGNSIFIFKN